MYGFYTDSALARAAFSIIEADGKPLFGIPQSAIDEFRKLEKEGGNSGQFSTYWDKVLQNFCPDANGWRERSSVGLTGTGPLCVGLSLLLATFVHFHGKRKGGILNGIQR